MALCAVGIGRLRSLPEFRRQMTAVQSGAGRIIQDEADLLEEFASRDFSRIMYLGTDSLEGAMHEAALKILEMTAGRVISACNSFLGVRHGPQVFIDETCAVVACLSADPRVRRYEADLLGELRRKGQGRRILAISASEDTAAREVADDVATLGPAGGGIPEDLRIFTDLVACQILAFTKSRACGLGPDNPSPSGVINRVVQGVAIYDP
jgi:tagatose-6-phosphate ketose/aldose isomerase